MKILIATGLAALLAVTGCATTSVEVTDRDGNQVKIPAELYAVKMQMEYAERQTEKTCDKISESFVLPEGTKLQDAGVVAIAFAQGQAREDCADAMADIARTNRPANYLAYKLESKKATWDIVFKGAGLALTAGCLFRVGGMCDGGGYGGDGGGNTYGDNWVFNQSSGGGSSSGHGGSGGGELAPGGEGVAGTYRPSNNINFGHGNVMGSDLSSSLAGLNDHLTFVNGGGTLDQSTDQSKSLSNQSTGADSNAEQVDGADIF